MRNNASTKQCQHCQAEVPYSATKCSHCGSDQRSWINRHPILAIISVFFCILFVSSALGNQNPSTVTKESISADQQPTINPGIPSKNTVTPKTPSVKSNTDSAKNAQYQQLQLSNMSAQQDEFKLVDFKGTMDVTPIKVTDDKGSAMYLMTVVDGSVTATLLLNKYTLAFGGTKDDEVEVKGAVASSISFCHNTDASLAHWCSLLGLQDGGLLVVPVNITNLNPEHPSTVNSTHF
jgi:hypothetical protein